VIALLTTLDPVKLSAVRALLATEGIASEVFDVAAGGLWTAILPQRLMVGADEADRARFVLRSAGFSEAADGDWDLAPGRRL
jgi:hypothetical protein